MDFGQLFGSFDNFASFTLGGLVFGAIYAQAEKVEREQAQQAIASA